MRHWTYIAVGIGLVLAVAVWYSGRAETAVAIDLVDLFDQAVKRSTLPDEEAFAVTDEVLAGESKRAIFAHPPSRITWQVTVPRDAWLRTSLGIKPEAWDGGGDGVLFRIGISDGRSYDELLFQHVHPQGSKGDRRWMPVTIDLSPYAREEVELIFNTNTSLPGEGDDSEGDLALWGEPQIFVRR
jgi:hypothetical protein